MKIADLLQAAFRQSQTTMEMLVADLDDAELLRRPAPNANHPAWQLGHLIGAEHSMLTFMGAKMPPLPEGFVERHAPENAGSDDPGDFETKARYLELYAEQRAATLAFVAEVDEAALDAPGPERIQRVAPTVGAGLTLMALHQTFHAGQFAPLRRQLGKPNAF